MSSPSDLETQLRELLNGRAEQLLPSINTGSELQRLKARFPRERRRGTVTLVAAAAAALALVGGLSASVVELTNGSRGAGLPAAPAPLLPPAAASLVPTALPGGELRARKVNGFDAPSPELVMNGVVWVDDLQSGLIARINVATMQVLGDVYYPLQPGQVPGALTRVGGVVLLPISSPPAIGPTVIARFDATTGEHLSGIVVKAAGALVTTPQGVFATVADNTVGLLDVARSRVVRTFEMPVDRSLAYADGLLWGWDIRHSLLVGVDPASGKRMRVFSLPGYSDRPLTAIDDQTLLIDAPNGTAELDVATGQAPAYTHAEAPSYSPDANGDLWGVVDGHALVELDPVTLRMLHNYSVSNVDRVLAVADQLFAADDRGGVVRAYDLRQLRAGK